MPMLGPSRKKSVKLSLSRKSVTLIVWYMESQRERTWLSTLGSNYQVLHSLPMGVSNLMGPVVPNHLSSMVMRIDPRP